MSFSGLFDHPDKQCAAENERFLDIFDTSNEGLWEMSPDLQVNFYNASFYNHFDLKQQGSDLAAWTSLIHPDDLSSFSDNLTEHVTSKTSRVNSRYRVKDKTGQYRWIEATGVTKFDEDGQLLYMVGSHKDVTAEKQQQLYLYEAAFIDSLTGLLNRTKLVVDLKTGFFDDAEGALLYINLSEFRLYNDSLGYKAGNQLLCQIANCLIRVFNDECRLYRLHADEFAVLMTGNIQKSAIISNIKSLLNTFKHSAQPSQANFEHKINIGVSLLPSGADNEESLITQTKLTMRFAKEHTEEAYAFFDKENQHQVQKRFYIETGIRGALENDEFYLKYQPIVSAHKGAIDSFEALIRWDSHLYGEIMPDEFIPVAEKNREIIKLGMFVMDTACSFISRYNQANHTQVKIAVNISVLQLMQSDFVEKVTQLAARHSLPPQRIVLEVTESLLLDSNSFAKEQISQLRQQGFDVSLDDFGTGYSSLNSFFTLPFTQLKVDRSVVNKALNSSQASAYITFLSQLCHDNNIEVVAEGIENDEMVNASKEWGMGLLQGYFYAKPLSEQQLL